MSVTNEIQIQKSRQLIDGFRKNINELRNKAVTDEELDKMEKDLNALVEANNECDEIRAQMSEKIQKTHKILTEIKDTFIQKKKLIKGLYLPEEWMKYGITDKR